MAEVQRDPLIGKVLNGRFEIVAPIASGGMGQIYRAIQRPLDRVVALKVLNPNFDGSKDPNFEERFFLEALTTAKLRHPNTITLYDYGRSDEGIYFMALELVEGRTLQQILVQDGPMSWPRALCIGAQVARALREAHELGVVHRDLKPGNIMLVSEGPLGDRVKLLDFGLVKSIPLADAPAEAPLDLTEASVVLGSPLYMAPEQAKKKIDARSDIYSLGAVMYAAMAGRTPFLGKKPFELMLKHLHEKPPELSRFADVPGAVNELVMRCLAKIPEMRFQNADALLLAMHQALSEQGIAGLFLTPGLAPASPKLGEAPPRPAQVVPTPVEAPPKPVQAPPKLVVVAPEPRQHTPPPLPRRPRARRLEKAWRGVLFWTVVLGAASSALGAALVAASKASPPRHVEHEVAPAEVLFDITSEPSGAAVLHGKSPAGVTPLQVAVARGGEETPRLNLALVLPGYETAVVAAEGREPVVAVHQHLVRRSHTIPLKLSAHGVATPAAKFAAPKKAPVPARASYRDDPYE